MVGGRSNITSVRAALVFIYAMRKFLYDMLVVDSTGRGIRMLQPRQAVRRAAARQNGNEWVLLPKNTLPVR